MSEKQYPFPKQTGVLQKHNFNNKVYKYNDKELSEMTEKRFAWKTEKLQHSDDEVLLVVDNENKDWKGHILNIVDLLNEQQAIIEAKDKEIAELDQQCADFLGDKIKALEEFEECTDKLKQKIFDYKFEIKKLKMENDALRYALKYVRHIEVEIDVDGVIDDE